MLALDLMSNASGTIVYEQAGKTFGAVAALDDVSLHIDAGTFACIVGGSGSGKTTLLRLANRLLEADRGRVLVSGQDVRETDAINLRRSIGTVFQSGGLFPHMSVSENIGITPKLLRWQPREIDARVDELLRLVQLEPARYRHRFPHELSGGERQRVGVARALAARPQIVLMDEPFGALDPVTRDALGEDVQRLHRELKLTIVMITHDIIEALLLADRIVVLDAGRLAGAGTPRELMQSSVPAIRALLDAPRKQAEKLNALLPRATP